MEKTLLDVFLIVLLISFVPVLLIGIRTFLRYRGTRVVTCPETKKPVAVRVDPHLAASTAITGDTTLHLESCTRWPERKDCGQECLSQIEASPEGCLVRNILANWYTDRFCAFCRKGFGSMERGVRKAALLTPDGRTLEWADIRPETVHAVLATHQPVCWDCYIAKEFHDRFPELVTERRSRSERRAS